MTRLPLLPISFLLALASVSALVYQKTRAAAEPEAVVQVDRVAQAVATTSATKSFTFTYSATLTAAGESLTMSGDGAYDLQRKLGAMKMRLHVTAPDAPATLGDMDFVFDNSNGVVEYMHMSLLDGHLPAGKSWVKIDVGALGKSEGIDWSKLQQGDRADPSKFFAFLRRAANPTVVGSETVGGVATTHYRATVDPERFVAAETDAGTREAMRRAVELSGISTFPVHVWIDNSGYLRRMRIAIAVPVPEARSGAGMMTMSEELSNFDAPVDVTVPSAATVVDIAELAARS